MFDTAWIAGVDCDEGEFEDKNYKEVEDCNEDDKDGCNEMDANELADILQEPNEFQVPHETENEEAVFEESANEAEDLNEDVDEDCDPDNNDEADTLLEADDEDGEQEDNQGMRRSDRVRFQPQRCQHLQARAGQTKERSLESARVVAVTMSHCNTALAGMNDSQACSFLQTCSLKQGVKKFGDKGVAAVNKEMKQLNDRVVFEPISVNEMTALERKRAMESLIFLNEKRDDSVKARLCANGSTQRACIPRKEASSPTAASEAIITTGVIETKQKRGVMTADMPNAFVRQTSVER
jgi:hypothetical protein